MGRPANNYYCCVDFWATFVKQLAPCYQTVVCPVYLSLTLVYCGQMVEWIRMQLGMEVGLGPGHIVLDGELGTRLPVKKWGHSLPHFLAQSVVAKRLNGSRCHLIQR